MFNNVAKTYEYFKMHGGKTLYGFYVHEIIGWEHQTAVYFKQGDMTIILYIKDQTVRVEGVLNGVGETASHLLDTTVTYEDFAHLGEIITNVLDFDGMIRYSMADINLAWEDEDFSDKVVGFFQNN